MSKYIDADKLLQELFNVDEEEWTTPEIRAILENAPTIITSTERTGEWIFKTVFPNDDSEFPMGYLVCSSCGSQHANATPCNYCDNCGAKMKGGTENE